MSRYYEEPDNSLPYGAVIGAGIGGAGQGYFGYRATKALPDPVFNIAHLGVLEGAKKMWKNAPEGRVRKVLNIGHGVGHGIHGALAGAIAGHGMQNGQYEGMGEMAGGVGLGVLGLKAAEHLSPTGKFLERMEKSRIGKKIVDDLFNKAAGIAPVIKNSHETWKKMIDAAPLVAGSGGAGLAGAVGFGELGEYLTSDKNKKKALMKENKAKLEKAKEGYVPMSHKALAAMIGATIAGGTGGALLGKRLGGHLPARKFAVLAGKDNTRLGRIYAGGVSGTIGAVGGGMAENRFGDRRKYENPLDNKRVSV
jgi:hypothetical protein